MGLEILNPLLVRGIKSNIGVVKKSSADLKINRSDTVELLSLDRFINENFILKALLNNSKIKNLVKKFNPNLKLNMKELRTLQANHAKDTQNISKGITDNLPYALKIKVDEKSLTEAAYLHDFGKVLIPNKILNKPAKLTACEYNIMNTHSNLGYELLKHSGLSQRTLNLINNHHKHNNKLYNIFNKILKPKNSEDITLQILSTADKYSALTEARVYRNALSPDQALSIIYQDVKKGDLNPMVYNALVNHVNSNYKMSTLDCVIH